MNRRQALAGGLAAAALLPSCAPVTAIGEATGMLTPSGAVSLYGIAKGIALVALTADPGLGLIINATLAIAEPLLAEIQAGSAPAAAAAALVGHANALQLATAGEITVTANLRPA